MGVRQARRADLRQIAVIHKQCFPTSFSTQLGEPLLMQFYFEYMKGNPELFLVATVQGKVVGFCMGYCMGDPSYMKAFCKKNLLSMGARCLKLLLTGNRQLYGKIRDRFRKKEGYKIVDIGIHSRAKKDMGDLLSICVLPEYRGSGLAAHMLEQYVDIMRGKGRNVCLLSVDPGNARAVHFYENHCFTLYRTSSKTVTYARRLE